MHAALVKLTIDPDQAPAAANALTHDILPKIRSAPGFVAGYWLEPVDGRGFSFVVFETEEQARRSAPPASNWAAPGVSINDVDFRRVAASASPHEMSTITQLVAGVPVSDLDVGADWYTRFFGRPPDLRVGEEVLWDIDEHATLFIEPNAEQAGAGRITLAVAGLDELLEGLAARGIEHEPIETYSNGVRHVRVPDPDGNRIAFAEPPDAASASPRSAETRASS